MRSDVAQFSELMSHVMDEKQGTCRLPSHWLGCMGQIQLQLGKFEEVPQPTKDQARRILVHIANWACIAERMLREGK